MMKESTLGLIVLIVLFLVLLLGGSKLPPEIVQYRNTGLIVILACIALWFVFFVLKKILAVRSAMAIEKKLRAQASDQIAGGGGANSAELQKLQSQMSDAINALKASKLGKGALYALPWYMIIGPPGSGKTTALQESGLNFPYTSGGSAKIKGVGGTRNCDWWFTDQGIILDTAGRYTTELEDRDEWLGFLDMLKKCRKEKPVNGALVCIAVSDLLQATDEQKEEYAKKIRDRLDELTKRLELVFPVYLVFTKCDLLNGFVEFYEDFNKNDRAQVWGQTLPYQPQGSTNLQQTFEEACKKYYERLLHLRVTALATDRKADKKRNIYGFPIQFALAQKHMAEFVGMLFRPNPFQESAILRGFYFTSGTQEGLPIDQVVGAMSAAFGISPEESAFTRNDADRKSYFINNLFLKIIFPDQNLARLSSRVAKRQRLIGLATAAGSILAFLGFTLLFVVSWIANNAQLWMVKGAGEDMKEVAQKEPQDLAKNLEALDDLRKRVADLNDEDQNGISVMKRWGFYRGSSINPTARQLYFRQIQRIFLEPLGRILRDILKEKLSSTGSDELTTLADLLLGYRILSGLQKTDDEALHRKILKEPKYGRDGQTLWHLAAGQGAPLDDELKRKADAQFAFYLQEFDRGGPRIQNADTDLIQTIIDRLSRDFWPQARYKSLVDYGVTQLSGTYPPIGNEILGSAKGRPIVKMNYTVPGIFTQEGYQGYVKGEVERQSRDLATYYRRLGIDKSYERIQDDILTMYKDEYFLHWEKFLDGIQLEDFVDAQGAFDRLNVLSVSGDTALQKLFEKVYEKRVLRIDGKEYNKPSENLGWTANAFVALSGLFAAIQEFVDATAPTPTKRFQDYVDKDQLKSIETAFAKAKKDMKNALNGVDSSLSNRVERIMTQPISRTRDALRKEARDEMNRLWEGEARSFFLASLDKKYPFDRDPKAKDATMADFATFFKPKTGKLAKVQDYVLALSKVTIDTKPLVTLTDEFDKSVKLSERFQKYIKDDRFRVKFALQSLTPGANSINVKVTDKVFDLKASISGGVAMKRADIEWVQGTPVYLQIQWPGAPSPTTLYQDPQGQNHWGVFRLIDSARSFVEKKLTEFELQWVDAMSKNFTMLLITDETENPYRKTFFSDFKCPEKIAGE